MIFLKLVLFLSVAHLVGVKPMIYSQAERVTNDMAAMISVSFFQS